MKNITHHIYVSHIGNDRLVPKMGIGKQNYNAIFRCKMNICACGCYAEYIRKKSSINICTISSFPYCNIISEYNIVCAQYAYFACICNVKCIILILRAINYYYYYIDRKCISSPYSFFFSQYFVSCYGLIQNMSSDIGDIW